MAIQRFRTLWGRMGGYYQRTAGQVLARRSFRMQNHQPLVSFTFDDFPRSALFNGGAILERYGAVGTYYVALGLMGKIAPTGELFQYEDLQLLLERGHELGCHTFDHCHSYETPPLRFERSILDNRRALRNLSPEADFKTLSYPISGPRPETKRCTEKYFAGCRGGGQTYNSGMVDLNNLQAFFLEQSRDNPAAIKHMIDSNRRDGGWLIFATHDVCEKPTRFGCTPALFEEIVRYSVDSASRVLPMAAALESIGVKDRSRSSSAKDNAIVL
jgi:peptidoglycan/xylan/chitin deacetylase (PgdA/CDA1 family)